MKRDFCKRSLGDMYVEYKAQTGKLIPRLKGYKGDVNVIPNFKAGVLGEIHVPVFLAIMSIIIYLLFVR